MPYCPQCGSDNTFGSNRFTAWRKVMRALGYRYYICDDCYTRFRARPGDETRKPQVTPPPAVEPKPAPAPLPENAPDFELTQVANHGFAPLNEPLPWDKPEPAETLPEPMPEPVPAPLPGASPELSPRAAVAEQFDPFYEPPPWDQPRRAEKRPIPPEPEPEALPEPMPEPASEPVWDRAPLQADLEFPPPELDEDEPRRKVQPMAWLSAGLLAKACAGLAVVLGVAALFYWYRLSLTPPPPPGPSAAARVKIAPETAPPAMPAPPTTLAPMAAPAYPAAGPPAEPAPANTLATLPPALPLPTSSVTTTTLAPPPPPPPPPPAPAVKPAPQPAAKPVAKPAPKTTTKAAPAKSGLALQFGAFRDPARAKAMADKLKRQGYQVQLVQGSGDKGHKLTKVRYGAYANLDQARKAQKEIRAKTGLETVVIKNGHN